MSDRGAVMQWEMDRKRFGALCSPSSLFTVAEARHGILAAALHDVLRNNGTLVIVSTPDTLTVVQRPYEPGDDPPLPNEALGK